jgi:alpha-glucoside transport system substrate-binding protein
MILLIRFSMWRRSHYASQMASAQAAFDAESTLNGRKKEMRTHPRGLTKLTATLAVVAMSFGLAACGGSSDTGGAGDKNGTVWMSVDPLVFDGLQKEIVKEAADQGITVDIQKVTDINTLIMTKIQAGDTPDIALIPQPGVVADIVSRDAAKPIDFLDASATSDMVPGTLDAGTVNGTLYGLLVSMNVKSLVYYPKKAWDAAGYTAPDSLDGLLALTDQIKADGGTPWCLGIESADATGWPATDWFEDLIMRYGGADVYKQWVTHELPFDSDVVKQAADYFGKIAFTDGNVAGGKESIASTGFGDADNPMWKNPPGCWLLKQGNFIVSKDFMPADVIANVDENIGVFGFPPATAGGDDPTLGGGDMAVMFADDDSTKAVMKIMADKQVGVQAAPSSSFISPHTSFDVSLYPNDLTRQIADVAYKSTTLLFDGSDSMPGAVGTAFWQEATAWLSGQEDIDTALKNIDQSWPSS